MKLFGALSLIMGLFISISIIFIFKKEKESRKKLIAELIIYLTVGVILLAIGVLSFIDLFKYQGLLYTLILLFVLTFFLIYITVTDKKGKKVIKYKTEGKGRNKKLVEDKYKYDDKK